MQPSPFTLWVSHHLTADTEIGHWPARPDYVAYVFAGHIRSVVSLWGGFTVLPTGEVQPFTSPMTGPMTRERWLLEKRLGELNAASRALVERRTIHDQRPVKAQVFEFATMHKIRLRNIEDWRPAALGTYTHTSLPLGPLHDGITDGVVAWFLTARRVYAPAYAGGGSLTVYDPVFVQLSNLAFKPASAPDKPAGDPPTPTKRRGRPSKRINMLDII